MIYVITPLSLILLVNSILLAILGFYLLRQKRYYFFPLLLLATALWALAGFMENGLLDIAAKVLWSKISCIGVLAVTPFWFLFSLQYSQVKNSFIKRVNYFIWIMPLIILTLAFTNEYHNLFWSKIEPVSGAINNALVYSRGLGVYMSLVYSYTLIVTGIVILVIYAFKISRIQRLQLLTLFLGLLLPWIFNFIYFSYSPDFFQGIDITPIAFVVTGVFAALSIFKYKFSAIIPAAKDLVYSNLEIGVVLVNNENIVVDFNSTAKRLLENDLIDGVALAKINLTPKLTLENIIGKNENQVINLISKNKWIDIHVNSLNDKLGHLIGRAILFYDVTVQKNVEQKLQESNKFFSDLTDFLPDPIYVINAERKVVFWNKAMENLTKVKSKDIVGKGDHEYSFPFYGKRRPMLVDLIFDDTDKADWELYKNEKIEKIGDLISLKAFNKVLREGGIYLWILAQPVFDSNGKVIYAIESIRDINDAHRNEEELKNKLEELSAMNKVMVNRELKMIKLKEELDILKKNIVK